MLTQISVAVYARAYVCPCLSGVVANVLHFFLSFGVRVLLVLDSAML